MKSIIQEASSIAKAIELGWLKAGKPQQFSIKIYQEAEKNFFGITTKPAKIAVLFNDQAETTSASKPAPQPKVRPLEPKPERMQKKTIPSWTADELADTKRHAPKKTEARPLVAAEEKKSSILWTEELTKAANDWIRESLSSLGYGHVTFSTTARKQLLKIEFSTQLLTDETKQKHLFRSLAFLLLQSLRRQFKRSLRNARVVLLSEK